VPFPETGVQLFEEGGLLRGDLDRRLGIPRLQRRPAVDLRAKTVFVEDLLDRDRREPDPLQRQHRLVPVAAPGGMRERQILDLLDHLRRCRLRVAVVDRRQVLEPAEALGLEPAFPFIKAGPVHAPLPAGLGHVAEIPGQFQHAWALSSHLAGGITGRRVLRCR